MRNGNQVLHIPVNEKEKRMKKKKKREKKKRKELVIGKLQSYWKKRDI